MEAVDEARVEEVRPGILSHNPGLDVACNAVEGQVAVQIFRGELLRKNERRSRPRLRISVENKNSV